MLSDLLDLQKAADDQGDSTRSGIILEILTREQEQKIWHQINLMTCLPQGGNPLSICVQSGPVINTYDTKGDVVGHTSNHLSKHYCLACSAPCYCGQLFDDLDFMGNTKCAQQILEDTYDYPPDTDIWTKRILQEAHYTFSQMSGAEIAMTITSNDFQNFWQWSNERTSYSFSRIAFLHYKAVTSHPMLVTMHTAYLTGCTRKGVPLVRWGIGLTVLLENMVGNNFVHKLWAICLLKADFNWVNKVIFAKRMIGPALENNLIAGKCF
jgi:hypothetical protein